MPFIHKRREHHTFLNSRTNAGENRLDTIVYFICSQTIRDCGSAFGIGVNHTPLLFHQVLLLSFLLSLDMKSGLTTINPNAPRLSVAGPMRAVKNQPAARRSSAVASRRQTLAHPGEDSASNDRRKSVRSTFASSRRAADPREISSKKYQSECKRKLIEYLTSHGYSETPLSMKTLQSPNQQDFLAMLSFLWRQIDANHKWGDKPHEDIPRLFQQLKYPSVLNKVRKNHSISSLKELIWYCICIY